jgi:uncharacterized membrane protein YvlD (DUF360 family)
LVLAQASQPALSVRLAHSATRLVQVFVISVLSDFIRPILEQLLVCHAPSVNILAFLVLQFVRCVLLELFNHWFNRLLVCLALLVTIPHCQDREHVHLAQAENTYM